MAVRNSLMLQLSFRTTVRSLPFNRSSTTISTSVNEPFLNNWFVIPGLRHSHDIIIVPNQSTHNSINNNNFNLTLLPYYVRHIIKPKCIFNSFPATVYLCNEHFNCSIFIIYLLCYVTKRQLRAYIKTSPINNTTASLTNNNAVRYLPSTSQHNFNDTII